MCVLCAPLLHPSTNQHSLILLGTSCFHFLHLLHPFCYLISTSTLVVDTSITLSCPYSFFSFHFCSELSMEALQVPGISSFPAVTAASAATSRPQAGVLILYASHPILHCYLSLVLNSLGAVHTQYRQTTCLISNHCDMMLSPFLTYTCFTIIICIQLMPLLSSHILYTLPFNTLQLQLFCTQCVGCLFQIHMHSHCTSFMLISSSLHVSSFQTSEFLTSCFSMHARWPSKSSLKVFSILDLCPHLLCIISSILCSNLVQVPWLAALPFFKHLQWSFSTLRDSQIYTTHKD